MRLRSLLLLVAMVCGGCQMEQTSRQLVGRWTLPGKEGWVDFSDHGSVALVSDRFGTVAHYKSLPHSRVLVESVTGLGSQIWTVNVTKDSLRLTFPGRTPLSADRVAERADLKDIALLGRWENEQGAVWEFRPTGTYTYVLAPIEEAGNYTLDGSRVKMTGYRRALAGKDSNFSREAGFAVKDDKLEFTWPGPPQFKKVLHRPKL